MKADQLIEDFNYLEDWEDRYRYVIELGRELAPLADQQRTDINKVRGCASQVWLHTSIEQGSDDPQMTFTGDSDAHIVRGLIAILFAVLSGRRASEILATDAMTIFKTIGLQEHLTPQRSNGLASMVERIRSDAGRALEKAVITG